MKRLFGAAVVCSTLAGPALAEDPVVVELYTSQGCSSCPAADEILSKLAKKPGVIALALHVDYWDYIGWKDVFADAAYTKRQKGYAHAAGATTIYTPQMVIGGVDHVVGARPMDVWDLVGAHRAQPKMVELTVTRVGDDVEIEAASAEPLARVVMIQLVRYAPEKSVAIERGENAGKTLVYSNIVQDWQVLGEWDGIEALEMTVAAPGDAPGVVILQEPGPGPILAAARIE